MLNLHFGSKSVRGMLRRSDRTATITLASILLSLSITLLTTPARGVVDRHTGEGAIQQPDRAGPSDAAPQRRYVRHGPAPAQEAPSAKAKAAGPAPSPSRGLRPQKEKPPYAEGELLVKYRSPAAAASSMFRQRAFVASTLKEHRRTGVKRVGLTPGTDVRAALASLRNDPDVVYAEPNYRYEVCAVPDDTHFAKQWALHNTGQTVNGGNGTDDADIDGPEAWAVTSGTTTVVVALVDTGVGYAHPDLAQNIWRNPGETPDNGIDDDGNGKVDDVRGWDFVDGDNDPLDLTGTSHGTHVAGIVAGVGNNSTGIAGVGWSTRIMPIRALDSDGAGYVHDLIEAIEYAVANGAHIVNCSWGGTNFSQALKDVICGSTALFVCAAGNGDGSAPFYPAAYDCPNIISVAATDQNDRLSSFSNYGADSVHVGAPGSNIFSTVFDALPDPGDIFHDDMESGPGNWVTGGANDTWQITDLLPRPACSTPTESLTPHRAWTDSPGGSYSGNTHSHIAINRDIDLTPYLHTGVYAVFHYALSFADTSDYLSFDISKDGGKTWYEFVVFTGNTFGCWHGVSTGIPIPKSYKTDRFRFRFRIVTNGTGNGDGVYIDDVAITLLQPSYGFLDGTSMSAPHVAGIAALVKSQNPSLTSGQIKRAILNTVDLKPSLDGKVSSGGRVNAFRALPPSSPGGLTLNHVGADRINLSWKDNSKNESGFRIERKVGQGEWQERGSVAENVTSYQETAAGTSDVQYRLLAYNAAADSPYSNTATLDGTITASIVYSAPDRNHVDAGVLGMRAEFSRIPEGVPAVIIDRPGAMPDTGGPMDGDGSAWSYNLSIPRHDGINAVDGPHTVSLLVQGRLLASVANNRFTTDTKDTDNDGIRDLEDEDADNDGLPDEWEIRYGLNHQSGEGANGWDGDFDNDGWANWEEFMNGTDPSDPASPGPSPPVVREVNPCNDAGIKNAALIPNNTAFAVRLEARNGVSLSSSSGVTLTIHDGVTTYVRSLNEKSASGVTLVQAVPLDSLQSRSGKFWVVYYRSNETGVPPVYPHEATIGVSVHATDIRKGSMEPRGFRFKIEKLSDLVRGLEEKPKTRITVEGGVTRVEVSEGSLRGAAILYDESVARTGVTPYFGPTDEIPGLDIAGANGVGAPVNLKPPAVFPEGVTLRIPAPGYSDVSGLAVYYYNGERWVMACNGAGQVQTGGEGWMIPGTRVNHNNGNPSTIEIRVYHFSAAIAGALVFPSGGGGGDPGGGGSGGSSDGGGGSGAPDGGGGSGGGGGCFITTLLSE